MRPKNIAKNQSRVWLNLESILPIYPVLEVAVNNAYLLPWERDDAASRRARKVYLLHRVDLTLDT